MKRFWAIFGALACSASLALAEPAGFTPIGFHAAHHQKSIKGAIFYPAGERGREVLFGDNGVWQGVRLIRAPRVAEGEHPVVLLSHGMGGNIRSMGWLAAALAESGAIVVAINHPNTTWGDFDLVQGMAHWTRAADLSLALDKLMDDPRFEGRIDTSRIMVAGFSYGGWTALSLAGVRANYQGYLESCAAQTTLPRHCDDMMGEAVRATAFARETWDASYADARVTHAIALDPGMIWGLRPADVGAALDTITLIGLGQGADRMLATDFDASGLADLLGQAQKDRIAPARHISALPLCKPMGPAILQDEGDEPVCTDPDGANRAAIHAQIIARFRTDLEL